MGYLLTLIIISSLQANAMVPSPFDRTWLEACQKAAGGEDESAKPEFLAAREALLAVLEHYRDRGARVAYRDGFLRVVEGGLRRVGSARTIADLERIRAEDLFVIETVLGEVRDPEVAERALQPHLNPSDPRNALPILLQLSRVQNEIVLGGMVQSEELGGIAAIQDPFAYEQILARSAELRHLMARTVRRLRELVESAARARGNEKQILLNAALELLANEFRALNGADPLQGVRQLWLQRGAIEQAFVRGELAENGRHLGLRPLNALDAERIIARVGLAPELNLILIGAGLPLRRDRPMGISAARDRRLAYRDTVLALIAKQFPDLFDSQEAALAFLERIRKQTEEHFAQLPEPHQTALRLQAQASQEQAASRSFGGPDSNSETWICLAHFYATNPQWLLGHHLPAAVILTDLTNFSTLPPSPSERIAWEGTLGVVAEKSFNGIPRIFLSDEFYTLTGRSGGRTGNFTRTAAE